MKNDDGALSFGTSVDLRGLETGISQIEAKIATMEGKLGAKIDGIGKAVSRSGITAKSTLEDVTNAGNVLDGTLGNVAKTAASMARRHGNGVSCGTRPTKTAPKKTAGFGLDAKVKNP